MFLICTSCETPGVDTKEKIGYYQPAIIEIEGCEYIWLNGQGSIAHKGNCKNTIHCHNN